MANILKMEQQAAIQGLLKQEWSYRRIARELGIDRRTVRRYAESKCTIPHTGSEDSEQAKCTIVHTGIAEAEDSKCTIVHTGKGGRQSQCWKHRDFIEDSYKQGLTIERIHQDLKVQYGFTGSYYSVRRFVHSLGIDEQERIFRMECEPGEEGQIDYGTMYLVEGSKGRPKKVHLLMVTLSHSRKCYVEAVWNQSTESFIRSLENAFRYFGGTPRRLCPDNLAAAVTKADWYEPQLNPKVRSFAEHYGVVVMPARPYQPTDKGKVEAGIKYVKSNALKGRRFDSLEAVNDHLRWWMTQVADLRIHGTTKKQVQQHFLASEKSTLQALPDSLFECFEEAQRSVHRDSYVEVMCAYYEVPVQFIGQRVWVRWDAAMVRIFDRKMNPVATHTRREPGTFSRVLGVGGCHGSVEQSLSYYRNRVSRLGEACEQWADGSIADNPDRALRRLQGFLQLRDKHTPAQLNQAAAKACLHGQYTLRDLRRWLDNPQDQEVFSFLQQHELIRDPDAYGHLTGTQDLFDHN